MRYLYRWSGMYTLFYSMSDIGYAGAVLTFITFIYWNKVKFNAYEAIQKMKEKAVCC